MHSKISYKKLIAISFLSVFVFIAFLTMRLNGWPWPWYISRASGIVAYVFLFLIMSSGILIKTKSIYDFMSPSTAWTVHQYFGITLIIAILTHIFSLLFDGFLNISIKELFIPFISNFEPVFVGFGVIALYLFAIVIISSLFYKLKTPKLWRALHYLSYPVFVLVFAHGVAIGSDSKMPWMQIVYWSTASMMAVLTIYRIFYKPIKN